MTGNIKTIASSVVILAAGLSERMGVMKPLLRFDERQTFLSHIYSEYKKLGPAEIILVTNESVVSAIDKECFGNANIIINKNPSEGRLQSVKIGLEALNKNDACFIHNVDNPFVNAELLIEMSKKVNNGNYIVPVFNGKGGHPILVGKRAIEYICLQKKPDMNLREVMNVFDRVNVNTSDARILCNVNTLEDYYTYFNK